MSRNSFTADDGEMPYDRHASADSVTPPSVCDECGSFHHKPDCPYVQRVSERYRQGVREAAKALVRKG